MFQKSRMSSELNSKVLGKYDNLSIYDSVTTLSVDKDYVTRFKVPATENHAKS